MIQVHRRHLLWSAAGALGLAALSLPVSAEEAAIDAPPALGEMFLGNPDAKVTIIEYASATCPHCAEFHKDVYKQLKAEYIDTNKIKYVFREFPLNDPALAAFMIARASPKEAYFPLITAYFETLETWVQGNWADGLFNIAKQSGMTREKFDATLKDEALAKGIIAIRDGGAKFGVKGTPSFFINGEAYDGDRTIEAFRAKIDPLL